MGIRFIVWEANDNCANYLYEGSDWSVAKRWYHYSEEKHQNATEHSTVIEIRVKGIRTRVLIRKDEIEACVPIPQQHSLQTEDINRIKQRSTPINLDAIGAKAILEFETGQRHIKANKEEAIVSDKEIDTHSNTGSDYETVQDILDAREKQITLSKSNALGCTFWGIFGILFIFLSIFFIMFR